MASIFSRIIAGEIPCHKVAETDRFIAFLDVSPVRPGHTLVVPKAEIDYIFDIEDDMLGEMMIFAKHVAVAQKNVFECVKVGVAVIGLEVPHAHIHLVPMNKEGDLDFTRPKLTYTRDELAGIGDRIRNEYNRLASEKGW